MNETSVVTIPEFKKAIRAASEVLAQVRFGCSEKWVRISKADARSLVDGKTNDTTPEECEMYSGQFGSIVGTTLYVG